MTENRIIKPPSQWSSIDFGELYMYRHLLTSFAWRDIRVKYSQTVLGLVWAVLQPMVTIVLLSFVFQRIGRVSTGEVPPLLFTLVGYATWSYFSVLLSSAGNSVLDAQQMIKKIYFPRLVLPLSKAVACAVEFVVILICIVLLMVYYGYWKLDNIAFLPFVLFMTVMCGLAGGIWISALTVRYRDFRFITPFLIQGGLFLTPIAYPLSAVPNQYLSFYNLNPMVGIAEGFRWTLLDIGDPWPSIMHSAIISLTLLISGVFYFSKVEKIMADIL